MQTSYDLYASVGMAGQLADTGFHNVMSYNAETAIPLGRGLAKGASESTVRLPSRNVATLLFDADFVASNLINGTFNGVAMSQVTYASSHAATFAAVIAAIAAVTNIDAVAGTGRAIIITTTDGSPLTVASVAVTAGSTQAGSTTTYSTSDMILGVSMQQHTLRQDSSGVVQYAQYDTVSTLSQGRIYVPVEETVVAGDPVYVRTMVDSTKPRGSFRNDADSGNAVLVANARYTQGAATNGLAVVEFNLP